MSDISDEQRTIVAAVLDEQYFLAREGPGIRVFEVWMRKEPEKATKKGASDEVNEWEVWIR